MRYILSNYQLNCSLQVSWVLLFCQTSSLNGKLLSNTSAGVFLRKLLHLLRWILPVCLFKRKNSLLEILQCTLLPEVCLVKMAMIYARSNCVQPLSNFTLTYQPLMCEDTTIIKLAWYAT